MGKATQRADATLAMYLSNHDVACRRCANNLRGVTDGRCPQCRSVIVLNTPTRPVVHTWYVLLLWLTAWLGGFGTLYWAAVSFSPVKAWSLWASFVANPHERLEAALMGPLLLALPASVVILIAHRWIATWRTRSVAVCVIAAGLIVIGLLCHRLLHL